MQLAHGRDLRIYPFSKLPLEYRKTLDGFLVYSISDNLVDDIGASRPPSGEQGPPPDIVVRLPKVFPSSSRFGNSRRRGRLLVLW